MTFDEWWRGVPEAALDWHDLRGAARMAWDAAAKAERQKCADMRAELERILRAFLGGPLVERGPFNRSE
jgi:hypothetical protein